MGKTKKMTKNKRKKITRRKTSWLTLSRPSLTASFNSRSLARSTASWKDMEIIMNENLKRNWIDYLWSSFAPAFSCSSRSSPAFRCPVSPSARLPPTKIQAKSTMPLKLVQIVCYTFTLSKLFAFKSVFILKRSKAFICYVSWILTWVPPKELNLFEVSQSHLQAPFPFKYEKCKAP